MLGCPWAAGDGYMSCGAISDVRVYDYECGVSRTGRLASSARVDGASVLVNVDVRYRCVWGALSRQHAWFRACLVALHMQRKRAHKHQHASITFSCALRL